jgi:hypothetical protein
MEKTNSKIKLSKGSNSHLSIKADISLPDLK